MLSSLSLGERLMVRVCGIAYGALIAGWIVTRPSLTTYLIGGFVGLIFSSAFYLFVGFLVATSSALFMNPHSVASQTDEELGKPVRVITSVLMAIMTILSLYVLLSQALFNTKP